ncbi:MAG: dienelactone hydrolase family protein [Thermomicrobiales bacterium]
MCHFELTNPVSGGSGISLEEVSLAGEGVELPCFLARSPQANASAVLIIHDVTGASPFYRDLALRLAGEGFTALLPEYFVRQGPPADGSREAIMARASMLDEPTTLNDMAHTMKWLQDEVSEQVGIVGFCMGGTLALLAAGREPLPAASVAYYGFPRGRQGWPHIPMDEVANLRSPVLAFWGDQDHGVGMDNVAAWESATSAAGKDVEIVMYPGLPHGFLTFDPDSPNYSGAQDSWQRTLTFLREHLRQ